MRTVKKSNSNRVIFSEMAERIARLEEHILLQNGNIDDIKQTIEKLEANLLHPVDGVMVRVAENSSQVAHLTLWLKILYGPIVTTLVTLFIQLFMMFRNS